ncbi:TonB-dependent receptor [Shewanella inventionis]|jgi:outer membrane receptor protein involved in Fe transport|uniref:TonB-dependent receptor n=1 Tax=Shewanella inventionis TaxID=1738770 RepID=A0ABQ1J126_9GAMM|nr:TonB-dependent receptor [Shewanella inventionis]MCL1157552.1 TonB-dependent receptor [Shewanella inventionis]UAL43610.1 TonB-dependent receptor [Shewanella inventionis]GGB57499.1 TonB-dependent receptor [Shewanella inventionis]
MINSTSTKFVLSTLAVMVSSSLWAADAETADTQKDAIGLERITVTGVARGTRVMDSSVSVSSVSPDDLAISSPRSSAEAFRIIPGMKVESTGGEGNANIAVRGLPVASGGAKFLQIQEDGLPILQFGDIAFGNADIFLRIDSTTQTIESIRGGSASTAASNAPGGIINVISKTGTSDAGSVSSTVGLDYDTLRTDFEYGASINDSMRFHIGGFVRTGDGPRDPGYTANKGGQIKANITKEFDSGYVRLYFKHLDDKSIGYLPMPMYSDGSSISGFDSKSDTVHSANLLSTLRLDADGNISRGDMRDGMNPIVNSVGLEASFDLGDDWLVENRFRVSDVSGNFMSLIPAEVGSSSSIADSIGGAGSQLLYANGANAGEVFQSDLAMRVHSFDVTMNDFGSIVNDMKLTKSFDDSDVTFGFYTATQNINMTWMWNSYLMEVKGDNAALLDVVAADGTSYSDNGLYAYGVPYWGNCCQRNYDSDYTIKAPYIAASTKFGDLSLDGSLRYDSGDASGYYAGSVQSQVDMNRDGTISQPELSVSSIDNADPQLVNYDWGYMSYSLGANYQISEDLAAFGRISHGGRANADRLLFGKVRADGSVADEDSVDEVDQYEMGVKYRYDSLSVFATAFYSETEEQNFEATSQNFFDRKYEAKGLELEGAYYVGDFDFRGNVTWTDAEIVADALNPDVVGNTPRRQADFIYSLMGRYNFDKGSVGVNLIGTTDTYAQDNNDLEFDGYTQVNAFASYQLTDALSLALNVNNLFDTVGITEAEEGSIPDNNIIRARTINGRTTTATVKYEF